MNKFLLVLFLMLPSLAFGAGIQPYIVIDSNNNVVSADYVDRSQSLQAGQKQIAVPGGVDLPNLAVNIATWVNGSLAITSKIIPADPNGFVQAIKADIGGILTANKLMQSYPAFFPAIQVQNWPDVQTLLIDALNTGALSAQQYASIKQEAANFHIPITL